MPNRPLFADPDLARRPERTGAWVGLASAGLDAGMYPDAGAAAVPVPGGYAVFRGVGSPLTQVLGLGMPGPVTGAEMERLEGFFHSRGLRVQIELCPFADRSAFRLLAARSYAPIPGSPTLPRVRRYVPEEAEVWAQTVMQGFTMAYTRFTRVREVWTP